VCTLKKHVKFKCPSCKPFGSGFYCAWHEGEGVPHVCHVEPNVPVDLTI
jgi:hypothetical protein